MRAPSPTDPLLQPAPPAVASTAPPTVEDLDRDPRMERLRREQPERAQQLMARARIKEELYPRPAAGVELYPRPAGAEPLSEHDAGQAAIPYEWEAVQKSPKFDQLNAVQRENVRKRYWATIQQPAGVAWEDFDEKTRPGFMERTGEAFGGSGQVMLGQAEQTIGYVLGRMGKSDEAEEWLKSGRDRITKGSGESIALPHDEEGWQQLLNIPTKEFAQKMIGEALPQSGPYMAGAAGGGIGGAAIGTMIAGPPGGVLGFIIGSFLVSAGVVGAQRVGQAYDAYQQSHPDATDEEASEAALKTAGYEAAIEGIAAPLGLVGRSLSPLKHAAVQALIQPAHGAASQAASNVREGQPISSGLATAAAGELFLDVPGITMAARHALRGQPSSASPSDAPPPSPSGAIEQGAPEPRPGLPAPENLGDGAEALYRELVGQGVPEAEARDQVRERIRAYREARGPQTIEVPAEEGLQVGEVVDLEEDGQPAAQGLVAAITPEGMAQVRILSNESEGRDFLSWVQGGMEGELPATEGAAQYPGEPAPPEQDAWRIVEQGTGRELGSALDADTARALADQYGNAEVVPPRGQEVVSQQIQQARAPRAQRAPFRPRPVVRAEDVAQMSVEDIYAKRDELLQYERDLEHHLFGDRAEEYRRAVRARESSNDARAAKASDITDELEGALTGEEEALLFGRGHEGLVSEDLDEIAQEVYEPAANDSDSALFKEFALQARGLSLTRDTNSPKRFAHIRSLRSLAEELVSRGFTKEDMGQAFADHIARVGGNMADAQELLREAMAGVGDGVRPSNKAAPALPPPAVAEPAIQRQEAVQIKPQAPEPARLTQPSPTPEKTAAVAPSVADDTFTTQLRLAEPGLRRRANKLAGDPERAGDLLQDTMLRMWEKRDTFKKGTAFMPWAQTVMSSVHANRARGFSRRPESAVDFGAEPEALSVAPEQEARFDLDMAAREAGAIDTEAPVRGESAEETPPAAEALTRDAAKLPVEVQKQPGAPPVTRRGKMAAEVAKARLKPGEPTEAQKEAGNYQKEHVRVQGLEISIENKRGSTRSGTSKQGKAWSVRMAHDYGYIRRTEGRDGEQVDTFIGPNVESEKVFVVDQVDPGNRRFDEHKIVLGANSEPDARQIYNRNYEEGWAGLGSITEMSVGEFKTWLKEGDTTQRVSEKYEPADPEEGPSRKVVDGKVQTLSGRWVPAPPRTRLDTNRKATADVKKLEAWLQQQAVEEAQARGDDFNLGPFQAETPGKMPPATKEGMSLYLFGDEYAEFEAGDEAITNKPAAAQESRAPTVKRRRDQVERELRVAEMESRGLTGAEPVARQQAKQRAATLRQERAALETEHKARQPVIAREAMEEARRLYSSDPPMLHFVDALESGAAGEYQSAKRTVTVSLDALDPLGTFQHEAMHDLRAWFLTPLENQVLNAAYRPGGRAATEVVGALRKMGHTEAAEQASESTEERIAHAFSLRRQGLLQPRTTVRRILDKIATAMERVANLFAGRGFTSASDIFAAIEAGHVGGRKKAAVQRAGPDIQESRSPLTAETRSKARKIKVPPRKGETLGQRAAEAQEDLTSAAPEDVLEYTVGVNTTRMNWASPDINRVVAEYQRLFPEYQRTQSWEQTIGAAERKLRSGEITEQTIFDWNRKKLPNAVEKAAGDMLLTLRAEHLAKSARKAKQSGSKEDGARFMLFSAEFALMQGKVHGASSEIARALNISKARPELLRNRDRAINSILEQAGGQENLLKTAELVAALDNPEAIKQFIKKAWTPTWWDRVMEVWINGLLSNPATHSKNILGTHVFNALQTPEGLVAAALGRARGATDRVYAGEATAELYAAIKAVPEAWKLAKHAYLTEEGGGPTKIEGIRQANPGWIGKHIFRQPGRLLVGEDVFAKAIAYRQEIAKRAYREARRKGLSGDALRAEIAEIELNPPEDIHLAAIDRAEYVTFTRRAGATAQAVMKLVDSLDIAGAKPLKLILPFIRTPAQLLDVAIERSPAAIFMKDFQKAMKEGGPARDIAMARVIVGSSVMAAAFLAAGAGMLTGGGPSDPKEREMWRLGGSPLRPGVPWQPNSMWVGGRYVSIAGLDPISLPLGLAASFVETGEAINKEDRDSMFGRLLGSFIKNAGSRTWLQGLTDAIEVMNDPDRYGERWVRRMAGSVVPAGVAQAARMVDPTLRDTKTWWEAIQARIPGAGLGLAPRVNVKGEEITLHGAVGPDAFSPFYTTLGGRTGPVARELTKLGITIGPASQRINGHELTSEQLAEYRKDSGARVWARLDTIVSSPRWKALTPDQRERRITTAVQFERRAASHRMKRKYPVLRRPARLLRKEA